MADMKLAIGIGWAIMKGETRRVFACLAKLFIDINILPILQNLRFFCRQTAPHRKICSWQENCIFVIHDWLDLLSRRKDLLTKGRVIADQGRMAVKAGVRLRHPKKSDWSIL